MLDQLWTDNEAARTAFIPHLRSQLASGWSTTPEAKQPLRWLGRLMRNRCVNVPFAQDSLYMQRLHEVVGGRVMKSDSLLDLGPMPEIDA
ncbi:MAG: hypothetical protein AAFR65_15455 [Pseudomonadota bacterium]